MLEGDTTEDMGWMSEEKRRVMTHGSTMQALILGQKYRKGDGVQQDYSRAAQFYHQAARQGNAAGQCNFGYMIEHGKGVARDLSRAAE